MRLPAASYLGTSASRGEHAAAAEPRIYWSPCLGLPPVAIASPAIYFGTQLLAGLATLLTLLFAEGIR
jgi:hypothetical protein